MQEKLQKESEAAFAARQLGAAGDPWEAQCIVGMNGHGEQAYHCKDKRPQTLLLPWLRQLPDKAPHLSNFPLGAPQCLS